MTAADTIIARIIRREGGVADVGDGKGVTRWGQTPGWLVQFSLPVPDTMEHAAANYHGWLTATGLIALCGVADVLADSVIDFAVHSGHSRAIRALQAALGARPDGVIGPVTREAIEGLGPDRRRQMAVKVTADRVRFLGVLLGGDAALQRFAKGWLSRQAELIEGLA